MATKSACNDNTTSASVDPDGGKPHVNARRTTTEEADLKSDMPSGMLLFSNLAALLVGETLPDRYIPLIGFGEHYMMYQNGVRFIPGRTPIDRFVTTNDS